MNKLTIDFETRGVVDLLKAGAWRYAEDEHTDVLCLCVKLNDEKPKAWLPPWVFDKLPLPVPESLRQLDKGAGVIFDQGLKDLLEKADVIEAHNMGFERGMWYHHMRKKYGFDDLELRKCRDSAAVAAMKALPRALANAVKALGLPVSKDMEGHKLMMKMCKPRPLLKADLLTIAALSAIGRCDFTLAEVREEYAEAKAAQFKPPSVDERDCTSEFLKWHEEPEQIVRLIEYCIQDVETEYALSEHLGYLPPKEQEIWELDQKINQRGIPIDEEAVHAIVKGLEVSKGTLLGEFRTAIITETEYYNVNVKKEPPFDKLKSPSQTALFKDWINRQIPEPRVKNVQAQTVTNLMARDDLPEHVSKVLKIRQSISKASVAKFKTLLVKLCKDGHIRDCFMYHGGHTGRWAGKAFQPQNMPRAQFKPKMADAVIRHLKDGARVEVLEAMADEPFPMIASKLIRPMLWSNEKDII